MPWTPLDFKKKHNKKLGKAAAARGAAAANEVLKRTGDEGQAVRVGNAVGDRAPKKK
jgi:hypothetical protein